MGCTFVEGHCCLSPSTAGRFMDRGTIDWYDKYNRPAVGLERKLIRNMLNDVKFKKNHQNPDQLAFQEVKDKQGDMRNLERWFQDEWKGDDLQRMPII